MDHKQFFDEHGDYRVNVKYYEVDRLFTVEDLYQAIKQRLCEELRIDFSPFASKQLIDTTDQEASNGR